MVRKFKREIRGLPLSTIEMLMRHHMDQFGFEDRARAASPEQQREMITEMFQGSESRTRHLSPELRALADESKRQIRKMSPAELDAGIASRASRA
jgi:hypothetical protein